MISKFREDKCSKCKDCKAIFTYMGRPYYGCYHVPYKGKFLGEIEECPKAKEEE